MTWAEYSKKPGVEPCVRDAHGLIVALCAGYSNEELKIFLRNIPDGT